MSQRKSDCEQAGETKVSRRRFLGGAAGAAGVAVLATQSGCSDTAIGAETSGARSFEQPRRSEWKRRETHATGVRGWSDAHFVRPSGAIPASVSFFGRTIAVADFAEMLLASSGHRDVVYAFWDGSFVAQTEVVAPLGRLAEVAGVDLSADTSSFVVVRSPDRGTVFDGIGPDLEDRLGDATYRYRLTFPRDRAVETGVVVFDLAESLEYYSLALPDYGARAFVKYFSELDFANTYEGPDGTALDDYRLENIPTDQFLDLGSGRLRPQLPAWS